MSSKFTAEEVKLFKDIMERYRNVSSELESEQKKADEIGKKVIELTNKFNSIKKEESDMMDELHKKYGNFSLQDVLDSL